MRLTFGLSSYKRLRGNMPELPVINMFAEEAPTEETGVTLQSRPGLEATGTTLGDGPVQALFAKDGVLGGTRFAVSNGAFYRDGTLRGDLDSGGPFSMDGYEDQVFIAGGNGLWGYTAGSLAQLEFPDDARVIKVVVGASRLIALRADTETFYWSDPLTGTIEGLSFASAESQPDRLRDMLFIDDTLILFGAETVEYWPNTNDSNLPFQPLEGRVMEVGVRNTGAACKYGSTFAWVTNEHRICVQDETSVISNEGLETRIKASSSCRLWTFHIDATEVLALTIDSETQIYRSGLWSEFQSYSEGNWIPQCYADGVFGSSVDGRTLRFHAGWTDLAGVQERRFRAGLVLNSGGVTLNNLALRTNPGNTTYLTGTYANPTVEMRSSRDGGRTWGTWRQAKLGEQGEYRKKVQWTGLGMFGQPGILTEFRVTDPVDFRASDVRANDPWGGI